MNPDVKIYAPQEGSFFKGVAPAAFTAQHPGLPELRYFDGAPPERIVSGTPWEEGDFTTVTETDLRRSDRQGGGRQRELWVRASRSPNGSRAEVARTEGA